MKKGEIMKSRYPMLILLLLISSLMLGGCTSDTEDEEGVNPGEVFKNTITLQFLQDWGIIVSPIDPVEGFIRFLLLILLFTLVYKGAEMLSLGNNVSIVIGLVVSLITVIFIPSTIILATATTYGTLFSVIIAGLPIALCFFGYFMLKEHIFLRTLLMGITWFVLSEMIPLVEGYYDNLVMDPSVASSYDLVVAKMVVWLGYVEWVVIFLFIINCGMAIAEWSKGHKVGKVTVGDAWRVFKNKYHNGVHRWKTRELNAYLEEEKEMKDLEMVDVAMERASEAVDLVLGKERIESLKERDNITINVVSVVDVTKRALREFQKVKRRTWREEKGYDSLKRGLKQAGKDTARLDAMEADLLVKHGAAVDELKKALALLETPKVADGMRELGRITTSMVTPPLFVYLKATARGAGPSATPGGAPLPSGATAEKAVKDIKAALTGFKPLLKTVRDAEKEVMTMWNGILLESKDIRKSAGIEE